MAQQTINIGASPNDGTGTPLRTAFQYTNSNFSELYTAVGPSGNNIVVPGSATITGDLTVDTNVLKVNTTTNRVGINTTTPTQNLEITGSGNPLVADGCSAVRLNNTVSGRPAVVGVDDSQNFVIWNVGTEVSETIKFLTGGGNGKEQYRITHGGVFNWYDGAGGTRMTLNSTGLGVGASPNAKLTVYGGGATTSTVNFSGGSAGSDNATIASNYNLNFQVDANNTIGGRAFIWRYGGKGYSDGTHLMTLDASGDLLVGSALPVSGGRISGNSSTGPAGRFFSSAGDNQFAAMFDKSSATNTTSQWLIGFTINNQATGSGQINANGASQAAFGTFSDSRLKENIVSLPSQLANILSLRPVEFDYKDGSGHQIGFVAQEMQEVYSDTVGEQNGFLTVTGWSKTEARLVSAIKELAAKVQALEAKLA